MRAIKYSDTMCLEFDDFKDGEAIEKLLSVDFEEIEELECELECSISLGSRQTYWQPEEPPECEDLEIVYVVNGKAFSLNEYLTNAAYDHYSEKALIDGIEKEEDAQAAALEDRWEAQRDEERFNRGN